MVIIKKKGSLGGIYEKEDEDKKEVLFNVVCLWGRHGRKQLKLK